MGAIRRAKMSAKKKASELGNNVVQFPVSKRKKPQAQPKQHSEGVEHTNRKGKPYYLHVGKTKKGNPRYHFSMEAPGEPVKEIPDGYEIYENPSAQVFLRKIQPEEMAILEKELRAHAKPTKYRIDVRGKVITIYWTDQSGPEVGELSSFFGMARIQDLYDRNAYFTPIFRFTLIDPQARLFIAERFCFKGSIDDWIRLLGGGPDSLRTLVKKYVRHLGEDSFYELM
jgi:hypothetical protein